MYCKVSGGRLGSVTNWLEGAAVVGPALASTDGPAGAIMVGSEGASMVGSPPIVCQVGEVAGSSIDGIAVVSVVGASVKTSLVMLGACVASVTVVGDKVGITTTSPGRSVAAPLLEEDESDEGDDVEVPVVEGGLKIEAESAVGGDVSTEPTVGLVTIGGREAPVVGVVTVGAMGKGPQ
jgi:hypothetical protein